MRNSFLEESYTKCGEQTIPRPFPKISKLIISADQSSKDLYSLFFCMPSRGLSEYIETKLQTAWLHLDWSLEINTKKTKIIINKQGALIHLFF